MRTWNRSESDQVVNDWINSRRTVTGFCHFDGDPWSQRKVGTCRQFDWKISSRRLTYCWPYHDARGVREGSKVFLVFRTGQITLGNTFPITLVIRTGRGWRNERIEEFGSQLSFSSSTHESAAPVNTEDGSSDQFEAVRTKNTATNGLHHSGEIITEEFGHSNSSQKGRQVTDHILRIRGREWRTFGTKRSGANIN